jgi:hypothetical protein
MISQSRLLARGDSSDSYYSYSSSSSETVDCKRRRIDPKVQHGQAVQQGFAVPVTPWSTMEAAASSSMDATAPT